MTTRTRTRPVIAIDGPAGAGKSTVALKLAQRLGFVLVDTGALYRGVALAARERGTAWTDGPALGALTARLDLRFAASETGAPSLLIDGKDRSAEIRSPEISMGASDVSKHAEVRAALLELQRRLGQDGGVVLEGRDIGTVVFPDAEAKVFLTAADQTRADRRVRELAGRGVQADFAKTLEEIRARDAQDQGRAVAPLRPADDAILVDTTAMDIDLVVTRLAEIARGKGA
ncbi:MAG TPA: (d)CMP kinase [Polyangiales bacterium]